MLQTQFLAPFSSSSSLSAAPQRALKTMGNLFESWTRKDVTDQQCEGKTFLITGALPAVLAALVPVPACVSKQ